MIVARMSAYVGDAPALRWRCCWSGPFVSFMRTAILTWSGSCVVLSRSYRASSNSHVANDSSKLLVSKVGFRSRVR